MDGLKGHYKGIMTDTSTYWLNPQGELDLDPYFTVISEDKAIVESCLRAFEEPLRDALNDHALQPEILAAKLSYEATGDERVAVCDVAVSRQKNALFFKAKVLATDSSTWEFSGTLGADMRIKILERT